MCLYATARTLVHRSICICRIEYKKHWIPNIGYISQYAMFRGYSKEPPQRNACFCVFKRIFVRLGPSVRLEENNNFLIQFYLQPNSL